jgi:hypothetical protein
MSRLITIARRRLHRRLPQSLKVCRGKEGNKVKSCVEVERVIMLIRLGIGD